MALLWTLPPTLDIPWTCHPTCGPSRSRGADGCCFLGRRCSDRLCLAPAAQGTVHIHGPPRASLGDTHVPTIASAALAQCTSPRTAGTRAHGHPAPLRARLCLGGICFQNYRNKVF